MSVQAILPAILPVIERALGNAGADAAARAEILRALIEAEGEMGAKAAEIVAAEARSEGWLTRAWRPLLMLNFAALVNAAWFGLVPPDMPPEMLDRVFDLLVIGIGGYVAGRSVEKTALALGAQILGRRERPARRPRERAGRP